MKCFIPFCILLLPIIVFCQQKIIVAQDGTEKYKTVQAAFNAIPLNNKIPTAIYIKNGFYKEKLHLDSTKDFVTIIGEDKFNTILTYDDHTGKSLLPAILSIQEHHRALR